MKKRIGFVDGLFVFAMILVVMGHCGFTSEFNVSYLHRWIYSFHMPIFFWLSGYLFNIQKGYKQEKCEGYSIFLKKKSLRLLLPLFVLTTLVYYPKVLLSAFAARPAEGSFQGFVDAFIYPADNPIQPLWFLTVLFIIYATGYWIRLFCKDSNCRLSIILAFSLAVEFVAVSFMLDLNLLDLSKVFYEMPFFYPWDDDVKELMVKVKYVPFLNDCSAFICCIVPVRPFSIYIYSIFGWQPVLEVFKCRCGSLAQHVINNLSGG